MKKLLLLIVCAMLMACSAQSEPPRPLAFVGTDVMGSGLGRDFELDGQDGKRYRLSNFHGKVVVLFFGFTHCPDVCPTTMQTLAKTMQMLGANSKDVQVLFVTLDPARDTQQVLSKFVPAFHLRFIGLRGSEAEIAKVAADFKVFYQKQPLGGKGGYSIDHSSGIYLFDRQGALRVYAGHGQSTRDMAHDIALLLQ